MYAPWIYPLTEAVSWIATATYWPRASLCQAFGLTQKILTAIQKNSNRLQSYWE